MNKDSNESLYVGGMIFLIVQAVLLILKLGRAIQWPWWVVLIPTELVIGSVVIIFIIIDIIFLVEMYKDYRRKKSKK